MALVIGNGAYKPPHRPLDKTLDDAADVAYELDRLGYDVLEGYNLGRRRMLRLLDEFQERVGTSEDKAGNAAWALVYYAGHGLELTGKNWLIPIGDESARATDIKDQTVSVEHLLECMSGARKLRIVILDACRSNPLCTRIMTNEGLIQVKTHGLARMTPANGEILFFAARHGYESNEGDPKVRNSFFTAAFLQHMRDDGLELGEFFRKVTGSVLRATEYQQEPFVYGHIPDEDFYFKAPRRLKK